jgi:hypothetical protein
MHGNVPVQFLGEGVAATPPPYPTDREGSRMADNGSILVTGAAGQLGAVGRTVTGLLLERGLPGEEKGEEKGDSAILFGSKAAG